MTDTIKKSLRDSKTARWTALGLVAFTMFCAYYLQYAISPLKPMLERVLGWDSSDFGIFRFAYGWLTVFTFGLIIGGIVLDKFGVRITGIAATITMLIGTFIKYWAFSSDALADNYWNVLWFNINAQVFMVSIGFAVFCLGLEVICITASKIIVKWFKGKELALAMGLEMAIARLGCALALFASPMIAENYGIPRPVLLGVLLLLIGFLAFVVYNFADKRLDASLIAVAESSEEKEDGFVLSDIKLIIKNKGFWLIAILCVLFYSAVFPFLDYAADLMVNKFHIAEKYAGVIPSLLPFGTILLTPLFGNLYDRRGKGASIMIIGSLLLIVVHALFSIPWLNFTFVAVVLIILLGIGFSLVPSAMWPSVPKIIPEKQLGTAYALIFWVQNIGLMFIPFFIGQILDKYCKLEGGGYDYTLVMILFTCLGLAAMFFAFLLKREDKKKNYGLEKPNIVSE